MAYTAWSVVYGEQPTAAKWNQLGANDAGFKDGTNIDAGAITKAKLAAAAVDATKLDNAGFAFNMKKATNASTVSLANASQNLAANGVQIQFTVASPCKALVIVGMAVNSTSDFEYRPEVRLGGTVVDVLEPAASVGNGRAHYREIVTVIDLVAGVNTISAGVTLISSTSPQVVAKAAFVAGIVLGNVTA